MAKDKERWSSSLHSKKAIKEFLSSNIENGDALYEDALAWEKSRITNINEHTDIRVGKKSPFPSWDPAHPEQYDTPITIFDAEVGGWSKRTNDREVIALGALKVARNKLTGAFETVDVYERYYNPTDITSQSWRESQGIHRLTPGIIQDLRKAQKKQGVKSYGNFYDADEEIAFRKFIEGSILSGHNILKADIPWVFSKNIPGISTIDTLVAMQNMRGLGGNSLDQVFKDMFGKSMEVAGFGHHGALDDTYAEAMVLEKLASMKNATGKSIQWILDRAQKAPYHLSPTDHPDIHGPSQLTYGPLYGYLKDVNYYISRRSLGMKPLDERYDIIDPDTGGLKDGFYVEDFPEDVSRPSSKKGPSYTEQFASVSLLQEIKEISKILHQEVRDFSGAVKVQGMSARPSQLRYLSKLVGDDPVAIPQAWKDAADVLGIPHADQSRYYKASFDIAQLETPRGERLRRNWEGKITEGQFWNIIESDGDINKELDKAIEKTEQWTSAMAKFSQIPVFNPERLIKASEQGMNHALSASRGIIPSLFTSPLSRFTDLIQQKRRFDYAPFQATDNIINASGLTLPGIGATIGTIIAPGIGTVVGGAIGGGIKGAAGLTTQIWGNAKEASIKRKWGNVSMGLDVLGIGIDFVTLPFKMLATATKVLYNSFTSLGGLLKSFMVSSLGNMGDLGNPLTIMTGVTYRDYQGLEVAEGMLGLGKGTLNKSYESHAQQIHMLYSQGSYNEGRLKAASMLGIFDEVYGVQGSYDKMINTLAKRDLTATDMALLSTVDSQAPQILQVMKDIGATSLGQLGDPSRRGIYFNKINSGRKIWDSVSGRYVDERTAFRQDYYEYKAIRDSFGNSARRIGDTIWRNGGKTFANTLNTAVGYVAEGRSWNDIKSLFKDLFSNKGDTWLKPLQGAWEDIKQFLKSNWSTIQSSLLSIIDTFIDKWLDASDKLARMISGPAASFLNALMNMRIEGDLFKGFHLEFGDPKKGHAPISFQKSSKTPDIHDPTMFEILKDKDSVEKKKARLEQNRKNGSRVFHGGTEISYEEAEKLINGIETFITAEAIYNTIHEGIKGIRYVKDKAIADAPDVLKIAGESVGSILKETTQEVISTVKIVISDEKGNTREINVPGEQVYFGNVSATMLSAESRGGR